jgi:hypothetical protein
MNAVARTRTARRSKTPVVSTFATDFKAAVDQMMSSVHVSETELQTILTNAEAVNDVATINAVRRAQRGDATAQLVCAMILGR